MARLGVRGGRRYAWHKARRTFASVERQLVLDQEFQIRTAEDVTRELGNMKGAMMKLGQMASYLDTGLPDNPIQIEVICEFLRDFVGKPYQARTLLELVRKVLDGAAAANGAAKGATLRAPAYAGGRLETRHVLDPEGRRTFIRLC